MANSSLSQGYAEALLALARARHETSAVEAELRIVAQLLRRDSDLRRALRDPDISDADRAARVFEALKGVVGELVTGHVATMAQHGNARLIGDMIERYLEVLSASSGITAEVHAAIPLEEEATARLERALTRRYGRSVRVQSFVDPTVMGGLLIRVGNELIDATVKTRLQSMRAAMRHQLADMGSHG